MTDGPGIRYSDTGVDLDAAHGQVLEGQVVALAQALDLGTEKMRLAPDALLCRHCTTPLWNST